MFLVAPLLLLAACGQQETTPEPRAETPIPVEPGGGVGDGAGPPEAAASETIPASFHGVWDAASGSCDAASELRLEIGPERIAHYESSGTVTGLRPASDGDVLVDLAMKGEGEAWRETVRLQLTQTGGREALLLLPGPDSEIVLRPTPRFRCPA